MAAISLLLVWLVQLAPQLHYFQQLLKLVVHPMRPSLDLSQLEFWRVPKGSWLLTLLKKQQQMPSLQFGISNRSLL